MNLIQELFGEYQQLRLAGNESRDVLRELAPDIDALTRDDKVQLRDFVRDWEKALRSQQESSNRKISRTPAPQPKQEGLNRLQPVPNQPTIPTRPDALEDRATRNVFDQQNTQQVPRMEDFPNFDLPSINPASWVACYNCGQKNRDDEPFCYNCGVMLQEANPKQNTKHFAPAAVNAHSSDYFGPDSVLVIDLLNTVGRFEIRPQQRTNGVTFGRVTDTQSAKPTIDLTRTKGVELGVSRMHLRIDFDVALRKLLVQDLGSANGSFLNDQRLIKNNPEILRSGDKLRLGRLLMIVNYSHPGEELP